jgi:hypothetical protein
MLDGQEFPDELRRTYGVDVLRRDDIHPRALRAGFGSLKAKDAVLWASPFETFLLLDADAVVWGDMRRLACFDRADFVLDAGGEPPHSVMDVAAVVRHVPGVDVESHVEQFANTGAYFGRRGVLDLDDYLELDRLADTYPGMFYGSQGVFNLMVLRAADRGELRLLQRELQVMTGRTVREEVVERFAFVDGQPAVVGDPTVLHWVGSPKPRVRQRGRDYFEPMTYFRREFRRAAAGRPSGSAADALRLRLEDALCTDWRGTNVRGRLGRLRRRTGQRYASAKAAVRRRTPDRLVSLVRAGRLPAVERRLDDDASA